MKTILATAYAVNPYKGSEDGMGWNFVQQIARNHQVKVVTRVNNQSAIAQYMEEYPSELYERMTFLYYDLPYWMRFWKKGGQGAMLYYYMWQLFMPVFILLQKVQFDIVHNVNFHNDWTPSFLWLLRKPMVWGPVGHHPKIPRAFLLPVYGFKAYLKDRVVWLLKNMFWKLDPFLNICVRQADYIWGMNSSVKNVITTNPNKFGIMPSVASELHALKAIPNEGFHVLSVGRFVPLKGFDVTINAFAAFYHAQPLEGRRDITLTLVGKGPEKAKLEKMCKALAIEEAVTFIDWIERSALQKIYQQTSAFLFPSHEGAGMVVAEAMSYGIPVLCFDQEGPGEFITNEEGYKIPYLSYEKSVNLFARSLEQLYNHPDLQQETGSKARARFEANLIWEVKGDQLKICYDALMTVDSVIEKSNTRKITKSSYELQFKNNLRSSL